MSSSKNLEYKKTSFLSKANSSFIDEMYIKFINKDPSLPISWRNYFEELNEDIHSVTKELEGPSWKPKNNKSVITPISDQEEKLNTSIVNSQPIESNPSNRVKSRLVLKIPSHSKP